MVTYVKDKMGKRSKPLLKLDKKEIDDRKKALGYTVRTIYRCLGCCEASVYNYYKKGWPADEAERLAQLLGTSVVQLQGKR